MKKFYNYIVEIIFVLILLIPNIKAENMTQIEDITKYTHNYFFNEEYHSVAASLSETTNTGFFAPFELGFESPSCGVASGYNPSGFFDDYFDVIHGGIDGSYGKDGDDCNVTWNEKESGSTQITDGNKITKSKEVTRSFPHNCYRTAGGSIRTGSDLDKPPSLYACASVDKIADISYSFIPSSDNYLELTITRKEGYANLDPWEYDIIEIDSTSGHTSSCGVSHEIKYEYDEDGNITNRIVHISAPSGYLYSPILGQCTYDVKNYSCQGNPDYKKGPVECNNSAIINRTCPKKTFIESDGTKQKSRAEIEYKQTGTITNILSTGNKTNSIHQGGGIMISFLYQNTAEYEIDESSFKLADGVSTDSASADIGNKFKQSIMTPEELKGKIDVSLTIKDEKTGEDLTGKFILGSTKTECWQNTDEFKPEEERKGKIITTCKITLPATELEDFTGRVKTSSEDKEVNNKAYTEMTFDGKINVSASITGLSVIKAAGEGGISSDEELDEWTVNFAAGNDANCTVKVEDRIYKKEGTKKIISKPLYRPIDINNPFPDRLPGVNWAEWYQKNPDRLAESYNNPQYQIELSPSKINQIKTNYPESYLDWSGIDHDTKESKFVSDMFTGDNDFIEGR